MKQQLNETAVLGEWWHAQTLKQSHTHPSHV